MTCGLIEVDPEKVGYIVDGEALFGPYSRSSYSRAEGERRRFIPP